MTVGSTEVWGWIVQAVLTGVTVGVTNYISQRWVVKNMERLEARMVGLVKRAAGRVR